MVLYERTSEDIDRGLVGYWKCNDKKDGSSVCIDRIKFNNGVISNCTNEAGVNGLIDSLNFNGVNTQVVIPNTTNINLGVFSLSFWIYGVTPVDAFGRLINKIETNVSGWTIAVYNVSENAYVRVDTSSATNQQPFGTSFNSVVIDNKWHHLVLVVDDTLGTIKIFIDGTLNEEGTFIQGTGVKTTQSLILGNSSGSDWFKGRLNHIRMYNRKISFAEISKLYRQRI